MKIITAIESIECVKKDDISIFLAGGITNCQDWRKPVISHLNKVYGKDDRIVIFNPRRESFDVSDDTQTLKQIKWEYDAIKQCDIFGMFFCDSKSVQPICMYELGKQLSYCKYRFDNSEKIIHVLIGVEEEYSRKDDVVIQSTLMGYPVDILRGNKEQRYEDFTNKLVYRISSLSQC